MCSKYFALNKTWQKLKKNKIINAEESRKHAKSPSRVFKSKWERKAALFQKILKVLYIFGQTFTYFSLFALFLNIFQPFFWKVVHVPLLSEIGPDSHGNYKKNVAAILTFAIAKVRYDGITMVSTMQQCIRNNISKKQALRILLTKCSSLQIFIKLCEIFKLLNFCQISSYVAK